RRRAARRLAIFENDDGMTVVHGEFDPVTGKQITQAIAAEADRLFRLDGGRGRADQVRTSEQRRADALCGLVGADSGSSAKAAGVPVRNQMIVLFTASDGRVANGILADGTPLPTGVVEQLACGSDLFALVLSADGDPLWMGRRTRLATDAQWRALIAGDGGCGVCGADPSMCEAHHIVAWQPPGSDVSAKPELEGTRSNPQGCRVAGGPTNIDNLVLLCRHHHHLVHDNGWSLTRSADGTWILEPP
ncbi:MAG: HNH endonuclease, partial [Acidimicrobiia bacterium]|nr:HNH endonuclease [Acidimicrobiia bacterium]